MKFQFEGYSYLEGEEYIEIDFDFMEKSEFIKILEPDLSVPVMIPEKFSNFQVNEFKEILEKINNKEELREEDKHLCKSKVLKPLFEYFRMDKVIMDFIDIPELNSSIEIEPSSNSFYINITIISGTYKCEFMTRLNIEGGIYKIDCGRYEQDKFNFEDFITLKNKVEDNIFYKIMFPNMCGGRSEGIEFVSRDKKLFIEFFADGFCNTIDIINPLLFLDNFYRKLKELTEKMKKCEIGID